MVLGIDSTARKVLQEEPWSVVTALALIFVIVGGSDALLTFFPSDFGSTEWEFGTITASLNGLPLPLLGLTLLLMSAIARERPLLVKSIALVLVVVALAIGALGIVYLTTLPQALSAGDQAGGLGQIGIKKAIAKTAVQLIVYPIGMCLTAWIAWRTIRRET